MKKGLFLFVWFLTLMVIWTTVGTLVTMASDIAVVAGLVLGAAFVVLSVKTKCFLKWGKNK